MRDMFRQIHERLNAGESLVLMSDLTSLTLGDTVVDGSIAAGSVAAVAFFSNLTEDCYLVYEAGQNGQGGTLSLTLAEALDAAAYQTIEIPEVATYSPSVLARSVGAQATYLVPEPATATLSLLALAALAARRRRK